MTYGMNIAFAAIMITQLREIHHREFKINDDQESWIVSIEYIAVPFVSIPSGMLQSRFGPNKVKAISSTRYR